MKEEEKIERINSLEREIEFNEELYTIMKKYGAKHIKDKIEFLKQELKFLKEGK